MKLEERLKVLGEKWANLPSGTEANEIADEVMDKLPELLERIEQLEKACAEMRGAFKFPDLTISSARAISFHARQGDPYAGLSSIALADWVASIADSVEKIKHALSTSCGSDYIHLDEIKPLVYALKEILEWQQSSEKDWLESVDISIPKQYCEDALAHAENLLKGKTK